MWKKIKALITLLSVIAAGMKGGQGNKGLRRFGIPGISFLASLTDGFQWRDLTFFLFIPLLIMGYGENSFLMGWLGSDSLVRVVYGLLLALPFFFFGWLRGAFAAVFMALAFSLRAGSLGNISWFGDILIEDIARYGVMGILVVYNIFWPPQHNAR